MGVAESQAPRDPMASIVAATASPKSAQAPTFSLVDLDGRTRRLTDFLGSKPVLLEFMSPDCPHCHEMAPILTRLHGVFHSRVQFLTIAFDRSPRRLRDFAANEKHTWPYLWGNQEVINAYRLEGVPTFYLIVPDGQVAWSVVGSISYENLVQKIDAALARQ
jgi:thiol-disulfide isomerase/thioredoxin